MWMMKSAKISVCAIAQHAVLSHLDLFKRVIPFKTFTSSRADQPSNFHAQFFDDIAFGTNCWRSLFSILILILTLVSAGQPGRDAESV